MTTVLLFTLLIWIPVFIPNLLSSWNLQPSLFFRQWITFNGLAGVFYFAVVAGKQHSGPFNWIKFVLLGFLGFATFGVATLGYSLYQLAQNAYRRSNRFGHKPFITSAPGPGLWWSFKEKKWSPLILHALSHAESPSVRLAIDRQVIWESDMTSEFHHIGIWIAEQVLTRDQQLRSTPSVFQEILQAKRALLNSKTTDAEFATAYQNLILQTGDEWPSNWCSGINARYALKECFINSLTPHQVHKSLYQAAISNAMHARFVARCEALNCDLATVTTEETIEEGETQGEVRIRGVDCPGIEACDEAISGTCESYETRVLDQQERCLTSHFFLKMLSEQERAKDHYRSNT